MFEQFISTFLGFFFAFIAKDFYDVYFQKHIQKWLNRGKELPKQINEKKKPFGDYNFLYKEATDNK